MTRDEIRRAALRATAKIALGFCAGCASDPPPPQAPTGGQSAAPQPTTAKATPTGAGGCAFATNNTPNAAEAKCCLDTAQSLGIDFEYKDDKKADPRVPPHIVNCCAAVLASKTSTVYDQCCAALGIASGHCTPWGPPVPPAMHARRRARRMANA